MFDKIKQDVLFSCLSCSFEDVYSAYSCLEIVPSLTVSLSVLFSPNECSFLGEIVGR